MCTLELPVYLLFQFIVFFNLLLRNRIFAILRLPILLRGYCMCYSRWDMTRPHVGFFLRKQIRIQTPTKAQTQRTSRIQGGIDLGLSLASPPSLTCIVCIRYRAFQSSFATLFLFVRPQRKNLVFISLAAFQTAGNCE